MIRFHIRVPRNHCKILENGNNDRIIHLKWGDWNIKQELNRLLDIYKRKFSPKQLLSGGHGLGITNPAHILQTLTTSLTVVCVISRWRAVADKIVNNIHWLNLIATRKYILGCYFPVQEYYHFYISHPRIEILNFFILLFFRSIRPKFQDNL